ncbi:MAG: protein kinase domain-containing protein, partial [Acidimicrobiales bacterium]
MGRTASAEGLVLDARYRLTRLLKGGSGVDTYLAEDLESDRALVVVKHVRSDQVPLAVRIRLEHEAAVLTRLEGETFRPLLALDQDGDHLYLVQPHLPGQTLAERLATGPLSVASTLAVATDVLAALQRVHEHDVLHRDLKPGNILVQGDEPLERAVLIDFGLARSASLDDDLKDEAVGTARYLAPEQAGLTDEAVDERSDLYSLGAVLYECLAGRPPFDGPTVGEVLRQHLGQQPAGLRAAGVGVPRALEAVVLRLLAKDPGQRYQSAGAALADVEEGGRLPVPLHLRQGTHRRLAREQGHGKGYLYPHDYPGADVEQQYLPDALVGKIYYEPSDQGMETQIGERLDRIRRQR